MAPDPHSRAIRAVVEDLLATRDGTTSAFETITGTASRHDLGETHPLVGRNAPDFHLTGGTRLADLLHDGQASRSTSPPTAA